MTVQIETRKEIREYSLHVGSCSIALPVGAEIFNTVYHNNILWLCTLIDPAQQWNLETRTFEVLCAWNSAPGLDVNRYIGKGIYNGIAYHIFETTPIPEPHLIRGW